LEALSEAAEDGYLDVRTASTSPATDPTGAIKDDEDEVDELTDIL
jgi:hypothetical protein